MKILLLIASALVGQLIYAQEKALVEIREDGAYTLSTYGASYFANLSLECTGKLLLILFKGYIKSDTRLNM